MIEKKTVCQIVDEWLEGKDYFLVEVTVSPDDKIVVEIAVSYTHLDVYKRQVLIRRF